ncbi:hypothetical protein [Frankia sp. R82]|uniref:hypothetical protein n=1 Tax=Frankia sp. R82 TaxID=2950553 RepID=UPI0020449744|nr:hypothetical protein [Frankia sp. R82]MCM3885001.1 hypothetical protein [Frankia sp. R82]
MVTRGDDPDPAVPDPTPRTGPIIGINTAISGGGSSRDARSDSSSPGSGGTQLGRERRGGRRRLGWRRRRAVPAPEAPPTVMIDGTAVITVAAADFVCCSYQGCGTLRPLAEAGEHRPCPGCGRV